RRVRAERAVDQQAQGDAPRERSLSGPARRALGGLSDARAHGRRVASARLRSRRFAGDDPARALRHADRGHPVSVAPPSLRRTLRIRRSEGARIEPEGVSAVLPVLNEHDNLEPLHARLTEALKPLGRDYEIIYVDDGSTDGSWEVLRALAAGGSRGRGVPLPLTLCRTPALSPGPP